MIVRSLLAAVLTLATVTADAETQTPVSIANLWSGRYDGQTVCVSGMVRDVTTDALDPDLAIFAILQKTGDFMAAAVRYPANKNRELDRFIGREISLVGICTTHFGVTSHGGREIQVSTPDDIRLLPAANPPEQVPSLEKLRFVHPDTLYRLSPHKTSGQVIARRGKRNIILKTTDCGVVSVHFRNDTPTSIGDKVAVVGFPESNFAYFLLINAQLVRQTPGLLQDEQPVHQTIGTFQSGWYAPSHPDLLLHGWLIRTSGRVTSLPQAANDWRITISDGNNSIEIETSAIRDDRPSVTIGCEIEVTGVCNAEVATWRGVRVHYVSLRLIPRFASDIRIIRQPPFWTFQRLLVTVLVLIAAIIGILLWNFLLRRAALRKGRELAREQLKHLKAETKAIERTRLAVELHDSLAQNLTGVSLEITAAEQCGKDNLDGLFQHLTIAGRTLDSCRHNLRDSLWDLRNRALEEHDMNRAVRVTLQPHTKGLDLKIRFNVSRKRLTETFTHDVLCIIRELVLNGVRHGGATAVRIAGCIEGDKLLFSVTDNGSGFNPDTRPGVGDGHFGIEGIRERLASLGGTLSYESHPGSGTKANVSAKLPDEMEDE